MKAELIRSLRSIRFGVIAGSVFAIFYLFRIGSANWHWAASTIEMTVPKEETAEAMKYLWKCVIAATADQGWNLLIPAGVIFLVNRDNPHAKNISVNAIRYHFRGQILILGSFLGCWIKSFVIWFAAAMGYFLHWADYTNLSNSLTPSISLTVFFRVILFQVLFLFFVTALFMLISECSKAGSIVIICIALVCALVFRLVPFGGTTAYHWGMFAPAYLLYETKNLPETIQSLYFAPGLTGYENLVFSGVITQLFFLLAGLGILILSCVVLTRKKYAANRSDEVSSDLINLREVTASSKSGGYIENFSFSAKKGELVAFCGYGKEEVRTLYRVIDGEVKLLAGEIMIHGREEPGVLIEEPFYHEKADIRTDLSWIRDLQGRQEGLGMRYIEDIIRLVGMESLSNRTRSIQSYSEGEKVLYGIAAALLTDPKILVLDGPFDQVFENDTEIVRDVLVKLRDEGVTILFDCENQEFAETLADRVVLNKIT